MTFDDDDDDERRPSEAFVSEDALDDDEILREAERSGGDPGIALLVEMARSGEIDPWNIDIIDVTDKYLAELARRGREAGLMAPADLARSAKCIFYGAALLNMKARALAERHARALIFSTDAGDVTGMGGLDPLELSRRGLRPGDLPLLYPDAESRGILSPRERRPRERALTLLDLIAALRGLDERMAQRELLEAEMPAWDGAIAFDECIGGAHQDDLERDKDEIRIELLRAILPGPGFRIEDASLVTERRSRAQVFLALLSLANDEEVELEQEGIYGRLFVGIGARFGRPALRVETPAPDAARELEAQEA